MQVEKWADGEDKICSMCNRPIFKGQPHYISKSDKPNKRKCEHLRCVNK